MECDHCEFVAKTGGGLASHVRARHPDPDPLPASNLAALQVTLGELGRLGRLEDIDTAQVHAVRSMARALDIDPFNAQMWRQYREAVADLLATDDDVDSALEQALAEITGAGEVGDSTTS